MYVNLLKFLEDLEKNLGSASPSYQQAMQAYKDHPNLRAFVDHLGCTRLCSVDVNPFVDTMDITHRTDEVGASLEVMPFIHDKGGRIYSDPPFYIVGFRNPKGFGECPLADWREFLNDCGVSNEIQRKVKWYLSAHAPVDYEAVPD